MRGKVRRSYAERRGLSSDGLQGDRDVVQGIGERGVLRCGECGEPEAAAVHQMRPASVLGLSPDHGTPHNLDWKATDFPLTRRERFGRTFHRVTALARGVTVARDRLRGMTRLRRLCDTIPPNTGANKMSKLWAVTSCVLLFACVVPFGCTSLSSSGLPRQDEMTAVAAASQLPALPENGKAMVYIVRPSINCETFSFSVFTDHQQPEWQMGSTKGQQYIYFDLTPGEHKVFSRVDNWDTWAETTVAAKAGDILFLQQEPDMGFITLTNTLVPLPEYEGKYRVKTLTMGTITKPNQLHAAAAPNQAHLEPVATPPRDGAGSPSSAPRDGGRLPFNTVVVRPFTQAAGVGVSQDFLTYFADGLRDELVKAGVARQVFNEGPALAGADAGDAVVLEGKLIGYKSAWYGIIVKSEITVYRRRDHALLKTMTPEAGAKASPLNTDKNVGHNTGKRTATEIRKAMN